MRTPLQKGEKILLVTYSSWTSLVVPALFALIFTVGGLIVVFISRRYSVGWVQCWVSATG